jgi:hypothetical protein
MKLSFHGMPNYFWNYISAGFISEVGTPTVCDITKTLSIFPKESQAF